MRAVAVLLGALACAIPAYAVEPGADALTAWDRCVVATEARLGRDGASADVVVASAAPRPALDVGRITVPEPACESSSYATIERWRGSVLIPRTTVDALLHSLATELPRQEDVMAARFIARSDEGVRVALRLRRRRLVTVVLDTEHVLTFDRRSPVLAFSRSVMTHVAEVADAGSPDERPLSADAQHGYLWRMRAYSRYRQIGNGVLVEMETVTLSRAIPPLLRPLVRPVVDSIGRESMMRTLEGLRHRFDGLD